MPSKKALEAMIMEQAKQMYLLQGQVAELRVRLKIVEHRAKTAEEKEAQQSYV